MSETIEIMPLGRAKRLDEKILKYFYMDTRSVETILRPKKSIYKKISETGYLDEWGIKRRYSVPSWGIV